MSTTFPSTLTGRELLAVENLVDREVVVVPGDQVQRHVRVCEALGCEPHPRLDALVHQAVQQLVAIDLLVSPHERVVADVGDVALELRELLVAARRAMHAEELGLVAVAARIDRDDRLARQVARDERDVGLVRIQLDGVQELPPRRLRRVEVARDVEPGCDQSGGSSVNSIFVSTPAERARTHMMM